MSNWQLIDTAPSSEMESPRYVLFWNGHHTGVGYHSQDWEGDWFYDETGEPIEPAPTHWMPLPDPPSHEPQD